MDELKPIDLVKSPGSTDVSDFLGGKSFDEIFECLTIEEAMELRERLDDENI